MRPFVWGCRRTWIRRDKGDETSGAGGDGNHRAGAQHHARALPRQDPDLHPLRPGRHQVRTLYTMTRYVGLS
jgi:hypothetical protein